MFDQLKTLANTLINSLLVNILKTGPTPNHIAFVMDGNRRYAKSRNLRIPEGHLAGTYSVYRLIEPSLQLGIHKLTFYTLSIDNLKRESKELKELLDVIMGLFQHFINQEEYLNKFGIGIQVFGKLSLLDTHLQAIIQQITNATQNNKKLILNFAVAYTATDEITNSVNLIVNEVKNNAIVIEEIDPKLISRYMYQHLSAYPDLLIRTSGEHRLSDFMSWQIVTTKLHIFDILWPEFQISNLLYAMFLYQRSYPLQQKLDLFE